MFVAVAGARNSRKRGKMCGCVAWLWRGVGNGVAVAVGCGAGRGRVSGYVWEFVWHRVASGSSEAAAVGIVTSPPLGNEAASPQRLSR
jgi:hypothetical protein